MPATLLGWAAAGVGVAGLLVLKLVQPTGALLWQAEEIKQRCGSVAGNGDWVHGSKVVRPVSI